MNVLLLNIHHGEYAHHESHSLSERLFTRPRYSTAHTCTRLIDLRSRTNQHMCANDDDDDNSTLFHSRAQSKGRIHTHTHIYTITTTILSNASEKRWQTDKLDNESEHASYVARSQSRCVRWTSVSVKTTNKKIKEENQNTLARAHYTGTNTQASIFEEGVTNTTHDISGQNTIQSDPIHIYQLHTTHTRSPTFLLTLEKTYAVSLEIFYQRAKWW